MYWGTDVYWLQMDELRTLFCCWMAWDKNHPNFWATPTDLSYYKKARHKFCVTNVFQLFLSITTTEGYLFLLEGIQILVVLPVLVLEKSSTVNTVGFMYSESLVFVHPRTRNCWTAMCTTTTRISSSVDCMSFKVLPITAGNNYGNYSDHFWGKMEFIMSIFVDTDDAKVLAFCGRIPSAGCGIQENACQQQHGLHCLWCCYLTSGQWRNRQLHCACWWSCCWAINWPTPSILLVFYGGSLFVSSLHHVSLPHQPLEVLRSLQFQNRCSQWDPL